MDLRNVSTRALVAELADRYPHLDKLVSLPVKEPPGCLQREDHWSDYWCALEDARAQAAEQMEIADAELRRWSVAEVVGGLV